MHSPDFEQAEIILRNLIHDLRQPLGNIEMSAFVLSRSGKAADGPTHDHILVVERQIARASSVISDAIAEMHRVRLQSDDAENREATNSATEDVT